MYQKSIPLVLLLVQNVLGLPAGNEHSDVTSNGVDGVSENTNNGAYGASYGSTNADIGGNIAPSAQNAINPQNAVGNGPSPYPPVNPPGPAYGSVINSVGSQEVITSTIIVTWTTDRPIKPTMASNGIPIDRGHFIEANADQRGPVQAPDTLNGPAAPSASVTDAVYSSTPGSVTGGVASSSHVVDTSSQSTAPVIPTGNSNGASITPGSTSPPDATPSSNAADESPDTTTDDDTIPPITRAPRLPTFSEVPPRFSTMRIESMANQNGLLRTALNGIQTILPVIDGLGLLGIESEGTYLNLPGLLDAIDIPCLFRCNTPPAPASPQPGAVPQAPAAAPPVAAPAVAGAPAVAAPVAGGAVGAIGAGAPAAAGMAAGGAEAVGGVVGAGAPAVAGAVAGGAQAAGGAVGAGVPAAAGAAAGVAAGGAGIISGIFGAGAGAGAGALAGGAEAVGGTVGAGAPAAANAVGGGARGIADAVGNAPVEAPQAPAVQAPVAQAPEVGGGSANNPLLGSPGRSLAKGIQHGIENGLDQSGGMAESNNLPAQSLDGHANDAMNNVGPQPGSDSIQNAPVNGMDSGNANDLIYPVAASSSPPPEPVQSGLTNGNGNNMYQPAAPMPVNSAQAIPVQDGLQRGINDNMAPAGGLPQPNQGLTGSGQHGLYNGYGNNIAPPAGSIVPSYIQAGPPQNAAYMGMDNNMNNGNIQPANNMGQAMPPAGATMNSFLNGAQGPPAAGQMIQPNAVQGGPMVVPGQVNYPSSGPLVNAGPVPIYAGANSRPLFPVSTMITPGPSLIPMGTPTPTPTAASSSVPPPITATQPNGEVVSCASGKSPDGDKATAECAGETKVISTVESIASSYSAAESASTSRMAEFVSYMGAVHASAAASKSASEAAEASWTSAAAKPSASCDILNDNGYNTVVFRIAGINGWTDGQSFSDTLRNKCHKNGFFVNFRINDYLWYKHEKSQFEGRDRNTEKVTFAMTGFKNGCVEDAIREAGGPSHTCDHKEGDKLPPKNLQEAKDAGENVDDILMIPLKT
ncbi:hypothetical protein APSETT445_006080 [Aspergillus pseudonomiae]